MACTNIKLYLMGEQVRLRSLPPLLCNAVCRGLINEKRIRRGNSIPLMRITASDALKRSLNPRGPWHDEDYNADGGGQCPAKSLSVGSGGGNTTVQVQGRVDSHARSAGVGSLEYRSTGVGVMCPAETLPSGLGGGSTGSCDQPKPFQLDRVEAAQGGLMILWSRSRGT